MRVIQLWKVFEMKGKVDTDSLDADQIRDILIMENDKKFDKIICQELTERFGSKFYDGVYRVSYRQFRLLWEDLGKIRVIFDKYKRDGVMNKRKFKKILEILLDQNLDAKFVEELVIFYNNQITFDAFYHANRHLRRLSAEKRLSTLSFRDYYNQVFYKEPSAPLITDDLPPSYEEAITQ